MPLYHWTNQIKSVFPNLSKPQAEVLVTVPETVGEK